MSRILFASDFLVHSLAWHIAGSVIPPRDWWSWCRPYLLLKGTADGEGVPLIACDAGDVQIQVVTRSVVERGPLDEEMSDLRRGRDQSHPCRPRAARGPRTTGWAIFHHHPGQPGMRPSVSLVALTLPARGW